MTTAPLSERSEDENMGIIWGWMIVGVICFTALFGAIRTNKDEKIEDEKIEEEKEREEQPFKIVIHYLDGTTIEYSLDPTPTISHDDLGTKIRIIDYEDRAIGRMRDEGRI